MALYISAILAQGIYSGVISMISGATRNTCDIVRSLYTHKNPNINRLIKKLDIENKLQIIQAVFNAVNLQAKKEIKEKYLDDLEKTQVFTMLSAKQDLNCDPIQLCLNSVNDSIVSIEADLSAIHKKANDHKDLWFSSWRQLDIADLISNLETDTMILDTRFNNLLKISEFLNKKSS